MSGEIAHYVDGIERLVGFIADVPDPTPERLELVDEAEDWIAKMRKLTGDYE